MKKGKVSKTDVDEGIIELTDIVLEADGEADSDFLQELEKESIFDDAAGPADDEVSDFFSSPSFEPAAKNETQASPVASDPDDFDSFLNDLEAGLEEEHREQDATETEPDETLELVEPLEEESLAADEKDFNLLDETIEPEEMGALEEEAGDASLEEQWEQALDEPVNSFDSEEPSEKVSIPAENEFVSPPSEEVGGAAAFRPEMIREAFPEDMLREAVEKAVRDVLEPIAERVFTEVAEQILGREIERLRREIAELDEEGE